MGIILTGRALDPWVEIQRHQAASDSCAGAFGATTAFVGTMRDFNDGAEVGELFLEHYPGMTEAVLETIRGEALRRWPVLDILVVHRYGSLLPGEPIVVVAVWSAHRAAAFAACRDVLEALKSRAPFWKRETSGAAVRWVEHNTAG
jgi:molybdopterin synthase catalytic subunit